MVESLNMSNEYPLSYPAPQIQGGTPAHVMSKHLSYRFPLLISTFCLALSLGVLACRWIFLHRGEPDFPLELANFAVVLLPFAFSILFVFVPDMRTKHIAWKMCVVGMGIGFSCLLWKQQHLAMEASKRDQQNAVDTAVKNANQHSDQQLAPVRDDIKDIKNATQKLDTQLGGISNQVSKSETELSGSIAKVNKPTPPELARLEFSIFAVKPKEDPPVLIGPVRQDKDGNFPVEVFFTNTSDTSAEALDVWIHVCDQCSFATEPAGFDKPQGIDEHTRHIMIGVLNPGTSWQKTTIIVKTTLKPPSSFSVGFTYSCKTCGKMKESQKVTLYAAF
jgi:hypothetical protein